MNIKKSFLKRITTLFILLSIVSLTISGCLGLTETEKQKLETIEKKGIDYLYEKYGEEFVLEESDYIYEGGGLFPPENTGDIILETKDGVRVVYADKAEKFYDDKQYDEIKESYEKEILQPALEKVKPFAYEVDGEMYMDINIEVRFDSDLGPEDKKKEFFHERYDGDIKKLIKSEKKYVDLIVPTNDEIEDSYARICLISENKKDCLQRINTLQKGLKEYIDESGAPDIIGMTQELFEKMKEPVDDASDRYDINVGRNGCWIEGSLFSYDVQNYIKVGKGIYVTLEENEGADLKEGDLILKEVMPSNQLQDIITKGEERERKIFEEEGYDDFEVEHFEVNAKTPIYEIVLSNEAKKHEFLEGYVKFDLDELGLPGDCKLYEYQPYSQYVDWYSTVDDWSRDNSISIRQDDEKSYYWFQLNSD